MSELPTREEAISILLRHNAHLIRYYSPVLRDFSDEEIEALDDENYYRLLRPAIRAHLRQLDARARTLTGRRTARAKGGILNG